jgi:hypothetical protein
MKAISAFIVAAVILALVSAGFATAGFLDSGIADAQQRSIAGANEPLAAALDRAEPYYDYASRLPWIGEGAVNDIRARKAALHYWQRNYSALIQNPQEPFAAIPAENVELQFLVAGALYRQGIAAAKDRAATIAALDVGIDAYQTVLKNANRHERAAYNYELLVRLRNEIVKGQRKAVSPEPEAPHGRGGAPEIRSDTGDFKVYIPLESGERAKGGEAGKMAPIKRKG